MVLNDSGFSNSLKNLLRYNCIVSYNSVNVDNVSLQYEIVSISVHIESTNASDM